MDFAQPLIPGILLRRYKRFLADVRQPGGEPVTVHCPNTGSMLGCADPGLRVWLSRSADTRRRYSHTWELVETAGGTLVGINTMRSNRLVEEALRAGRIPVLAGYPQLRREVRVGEAGSRVDFRLDSPAGACFVEVKNVTAAVENGIAVFPDAVTARGSRHLRELMDLADAGHRAVLLFCVQRADVECVRPADHIDPVYGRTLREAAARGVELMAWGAQLSPRSVSLHRPLAVSL